MIKHLGTLMLVLCLLLMSTGCSCPALIYWSPDGSRAVYRLGPSTGGNRTSTGDAAAAIIIDADGKILGRIGDMERPGPAVLAWSGDSKRLYYAVSGDRPDGPTTPVLLDGLNVSAEQGKRYLELQSRLMDLGQKCVQQIYCYQDGRSTLLFTMAGQPVWRMDVVAERRAWDVEAAADSDLVLQVPGASRTPGRMAESALYVYGLRTGRLRLLSLYCSMTHIRGRAISLIEPDAVTPDGVPSRLGRVASIELEELDQMKGVRQHRDEEPEVPMSNDACLGMCSLGALMTNHPLTLPSPGVSWSYGNCTLFLKPYFEPWRVLAEDVGSYFIPNPDGTLVLLEKKVKRPVSGESKGFYWPDQSDLAVFDVASGSVHTLVRSVAYDAGSKEENHQIPMIPAWRGKREICFIAPPDARRPKTGQPRYEVALYRITDDWKLELSKTLSDSWPQEIKPFIPTRTSGLKEPEFDLASR